MISLELNKIPEELYQRLAMNAKLHRRSLNSEILNCLAMQLAQSERYNGSNQTNTRNLISPEEIKALLSTEDD